MSKNHRETIGQRWIKRIYNDKNKDQTKLTSTEERLKIDILQESGYSTNETTDKITEDIVTNNKTDVFKCWKDGINDKVQDNATENENEVLHETRKRKINLKKGNENITKKSLLQELFLSDIDDDKRKPLNLDCLVLKPEYANDYARLRETCLICPCNETSSTRFNVQEQTCSSTELNDNQACATHLP